MDWRQFAGNLDVFARRMVACLERRRRHAHFWDGRTPRALSSDRTKYRLREAPTTLVASRRPIPADTWRQYLRQFDHFHPRPRARQKPDARSPSHLCRSRCSFCTSVVTPAGRDSCTSRSSIFSLCGCLRNPSLLAVF